MGQILPAKFGNPGGACWGRETTWVNAQGSGKHLLGVERCCRAGRRFGGGCVCLFFLPEMWLSRACCQHGYVLIPVGNRGSLWGVLGAGRELRGAHGWGVICQSGMPGESSGLCLSPCTCPVGCTTLERSSWLYALRAGMATFVLPKNYNEEVRAAVLKAVQGGFGCLVLIKNWWENRCQNLGFDTINLPAPNKSKRESWERQMPLQLTETSWCHVRFKEFIFLPVSSHLCLLQNEGWGWGDKTHLGGVTVVLMVFILEFYSSLLFH